MREREREGERDSKTPKHCMLAGVLTSDNKSLGECEGIDGSI